MRVEWTETELDLIKQVLMNNPDATAKHCFEVFREVYGSHRSYHGVQKKVSSLRFQMKDIFRESEISEEVSKDEEEFDTWDEHFEEGFKILKYKYVEEKDEYQLPSNRGIIHISGERIRELLDFYSNYGAKKTVNMIAREFGWARHAVIQILRTLGKTHDSAPFTDEKIHSTPLPSLISDMVRKKEHRLITRAHEKNLKNIEKDAEKWRHVERSIDDVFANFEYSKPSPPKVFSIKKAKRDITCIVCPTDLHVGKLAQDWSFSDCRDTLLGCIERALSHVSVYGKPTRLITSIGSDWSNIDTPAHTTTRGTPQRSFAEWDELMHQANVISYDMLYLMGSVAYTEGYTVPGNHDRMWSIMAGSHMSRHFADSKQIQVIRNRPRHYIEAGKNMIMLTHGDGAKPADYPSIMSAEAPKLWGRSEHRFAYHGHLHHEITKQYRGAMVTQMPSLSPDDSWHEFEGYIGTPRALVAYVHDHEYGRVAQFNIGVAPDGTILG